MDEPVRVLIVCLGNICRSPMGEAVLRKIAQDRGLSNVTTVDSCGTAGAGYHVGEEPDDRTISTLLKHEIETPHLARKIAQSDFTEFTHILCSDENNLRDVQRICPKNATAAVRLWGSYLDDKPIPDPYYGGLSGFERVYEQCVRLSNAFLDETCTKK